MNDADLDRLVTGLQRRIAGQERTVCSDTLIREVSCPHSGGRMPTCDPEATVWGECGDTMELYTLFDGQRIGGLTLRRPPS
jgi:hypothetical protein